MKNIYSVLFGLLMSFCVQAQTLNGITPGAGNAGQSVVSADIQATGFFEHIYNSYGNVFDIRLSQGGYLIPIFKYVGQSAVGNLVVADTSQAHVIFSIPANAPLGMYQLEVTTHNPYSFGSNLHTILRLNAFRVVPPDGYVSGKIFRDKNENGIKNSDEGGIADQLITLQPGNLQTRSDINGDYSFAVINGNYNVSMTFSNSHLYLLTSDSASFNVAVNNSNVVRNFGVIDGLTSLAPGVAFRGQTLNANLVSHSLFSSGTSPSGNITLAYIERNSPPFHQYPIAISCFKIIDFENAHFLYQLPLTAASGTYNLILTMNGVRYFLPNGLTITLPPSYISGHCYYDANSNQLFDSGERPIKNARFTLSPGNSFAFSNNHGDFIFGSPLGTHTLTFNQLLSSNFALSTSPSYIFTNTGDVSGLDFGFHSGLPDYTCFFTFNPGFMRCFLPVTSSISYTNMSNVVCQGRVYLIHSNVTFQSSNPVHSSQNADTIFWNFSNLQPLETRTISITFINPASGNVRFNTGIKVTDNFGVQQFQDGSSFSTEVRCSYDPNDKAAIPEGVDELMHYTLNSESLEYLIRFQNTGNDTAFNVIIRDTIDGNLAMNSLELIDSSHPVHVEADSNRAVAFSFNNILLADSIVDEPNSHGFVRYRISPMANLPDPTRIENTAYIYFDYNPAVVTNTTWNTMVVAIPVGIDDIPDWKNDVSFYPNPMVTRGIFSFKNPNSETIILEIYNISGQKVLISETDSEMFVLDRNNLSSGLYMYRLINFGSGKVNTGRISLL